MMDKQLKMKARGRARGRREKVRESPPVWVVPGPPKKKGSLLEWISELPATQLTPEVQNVLNAIQNAL